MEKYLTSNIEDESEFFVYLSDMEEYWVERYGKEAWDEASFEEIDEEIQSNNPELFFCDKDGEKLIYTTDINNAR